MQKNLVDNGVELYRIPIPHRYEITTGPNTTPQNLLVPISSHGSAFGHSISIAEHRYRFKSGLGDIGTYDILIGDLSGEISPDFNMTFLAIFDWVAIARQLDYLLSKIINYY